MKLQARNSGFTLLELLTVLAMMTVVSTLGVSMFGSAVGVWREVGMRADMGLDANTVFESMQRDFDSVLSTRLSGVPLQGQSRIFSEDPRLWRMSLEDDEVSIPIFAVNPETGLKTPRLVTYYVDRLGEMPSLMRRDAAFDGEESTEANPGTKIAGGVFALRIEYNDGQSWSKEWKQAELPRATRVSLGLMNADRSYEQISRMATFEIRVK